MVSYITQFQYLEATATPTRVALNVWSLTGPETATHTRLGGKPSCVNCGLNHTDNYRGCPKAPKFSIKTRPNTKRPFHAPPFPGSGKLPGTGTKKTTPVVNLHPPPPSSNPWGGNQPSRVV
ncbi:hypothetical protein EVAR_49628_1 [Eumeta japonica]|uniref:Nucleic-acid-binding protein from transposon X-element n=1 Tax=Eumeta variegata TaxID=151549 RepID=A0A4C1XZ94_EUMVA|nr:hypothetical protein EVAR_49628_1 [Eumeta japonica]